MYPILKTVQGALIVSDLILTTLKILRSDEPKLRKAEQLVAIGVPRNDAGGLVAFAESQLTPRSLAGMSEISQRIYRIARLASGEVLSDAQRKSALQLGFGTFIPSIITSLSAVHQSEYYNMSTAQKNQLSGEIASIFDGMWDSIPSASQSRLLAVLGLNQSSITATPRPGVTTPPPGAGAGSTNISQLPPGFKTLQEYLDYLKTVSSSGTSGSGTPGSSSKPSTGSSSGTGSSGASGSGSSGGGSQSSGGGGKGSAGAGPSSSSGGSSSSTSSTAANKPSYTGMPEGWAIDPDTGVPMSPEDQVAWKKQGWFINANGDWEKSSGFYDPQADAFMTESELNSWRSQGWVLDENGEWKFDPGVADTLIDPETGLSMSKDEYDSWVAQGWSLEDGGWVFDSSKVAETTPDPETGLPITNDDLTAAAQDGWYIDSNGEWKYDPDLEASNDGFITDPETGQSMSPAEYQSWNEQGWFIDDSGEWVQEYSVPEPASTPDPNLEPVSPPQWFDEETGLPITDGSLEYWESQGFVYDPIDQEFVPSDVSPEPTFIDPDPILPFEGTDPVDTWGGTDDDYWLGEADPAWDRQTVRLHDAQCQCDACLESTIFDRLSDSPVGRIHESSWFTVDMVDGRPGEFGEVVVGTDVRPFPVAINRNVSGPRMEASLVHELMHVAEQLYKTNMTHEQLHAFSLFVYSEVIPALQALRDYRATFSTVR